MKWEEKEATKDDKRRKRNKCLPQLQKGFFTKKLKEKSFNKQSFSQRNGVKYQKCTIEVRRRVKRRENKKNIGTEINLKINYLLNCSRGTGSCGAGITLKSAYCKEGLKKQERNVKIKVTKIKTYNES